MHEDARAVNTTDAADAAMLEAEAATVLKPYYDSVCAVLHTVKDLDTRDKRDVYQLMRTAPAVSAPHSLVTAAGVTLGEFSVAEVVLSKPRRSAKHASGSSIAGDGEDDADADLDGADGNDDTDNVVTNATSHAACDDICANASVSVDTRVRGVQRTALKSTRPRQLS